MDLQEIEAIAKKRGVQVDTVRRWVREGGEVYARTHVPGLKKHRGREITINSNGRSTEVSEDSLEIGKRRRKCELIEMARELGEKHLCEVWEE